MRYADTICTHLLIYTFKAKTELNLYFFKKKKQQLRYGLLFKELIISTGRDVHVDK